MVLVSRGEAFYEAGRVLNTPLILNLAHHRELSSIKSIGSGLLLFVLCRFWRRNTHDENSRACLWAKNSSNGVAYCAAPAKGLGCDSCEAKFWFPWRPHLWPQFFSGCTVRLEQQPDPTVERNEKAPLDLSSLKHLQKRVIITSHESVCFSKPVLNRRFCQWRHLCCLKARKHLVGFLSDTHTVLKRCWPDHCAKHDS